MARHPSYLFVVRILLASEARNLVDDILCTFFLVQFFMFIQFFSLGGQLKTKVRGQVMKLKLAISYD
jgi:hypothetical protein